MADVSAYRLNIWLGLASWMVDHLTCVYLCNRGSGEGGDFPLITGLVVRSLAPAVYMLNILDSALPPNFSRSVSVHVKDNCSELTGSTCHGSLH